MLPVTDQPEKSDAPDWSNQAEELCCPLCRYNLRGLVEPRCPECGYRFDWAVLTDPRRRLHSYLFEHHPEKNARSFIRTMLGQYLPWRFWRQVRPEMPSDRRRIILYRRIVWGMILLAILVRIGTYIAADAIQNEVSRPRWLQYMASPQAASDAADEIGKFGSIQAAADHLFPRFNSAQFWVIGWHSIPGWLSNPLEQLAIAACILFAVWPALTLLLMRLLRASMRQAKIEPAHVLRVVSYSSDVIILPLLVFVAMGLLNAVLLPAAMWSYTGLYVFWRTWHLRLMLLAIVLAGVIYELRMLAAFSRYLRFRHAAATVAATQLILILAGLCAIVYVPGALLQFVRLWMSFR